MVVTEEDLQGLLRKLQSNELSGCCAGHDDFIHGMQYEPENPLSGVTLGFFPENIGKISDEPCEKFHQNIMAMEKHYQGKWTSSMLADSCRTQKRAVPEAKCQRKSYNSTF